MMDALGMAQAKAQESRNLYDFSEQRDGNAFYRGQSEQALRDAAVYAALAHAEAATRQAAAMERIAAMLERITPAVEYIATGNTASERAVQDWPDDDTDPFGYGS